MPHWTPQQLLEWLTETGIDCPTIEHVPLRTVEDSRAHGEIAEGAYTKNLFVRNKKGNMWLLTLSESRQIQLKPTAKKLAAGNFSFASEQRLFNHLGIRPGAVSPLALINDAEGQVSFVLDQSILDHDIMHFHPLDNSLTTTLKRQDFLDFLERINHAPQVVDFDDL